MKSLLHVIRLDADTFTDEEFAAWIADPTFPDEPLSQIFSDLPPLVEVGVVSSTGKAIAGRPFLCSLCGSFGVNGTIGLLKELEQNAEQWSSR
uniref:Uncharacterized protein n=1 Tax=Quercus lobata TaxID=97700 RepID=A0A7N2LFF1_QUELO